MGSIEKILKVIDIESENQSSKFNIEVHENGKTTFEIKNLSIEMMSQLLLTGALSNKSLAISLMMAMINYVKHRATGGMSIPLPKFSENDEDVAEKAKNFMMGLLNAISGIHNIDPKKLEEFNNTISFLEELVEKLADEKREENEE